MNPHFINTTNVDNNSNNTKDTQSQQCMSDSVTKSYNTFFDDEHLPEGHITTHPFSLTLEELSDLLKGGQENHQNSQVIQPKPHKDYSGSTDYSDEKNQSKPAEDIECLNQSKIPGFIQEGQQNQIKSETPQTILNQESRVSTDYSVEKFPHKSAEDSRKNNKSTSVGQLSDSPINCEKAQPIETKPHQEYRVSTEYSVEKFSNKPVEDSRKNNKSTSVGQLSDSPINCEKTQPPQTILNQESRVSTDYSIEKFSNKPVGGSGWLHKYTKLTETKTGLVEYPRVKESQRSANDHKHWYWNYCWHKKGKNGKPLYKKGKAVVSSVGCPQKKVCVVERAIAAKLPHRQILEIIKGENSTRPPT
ncbi:MAG: hypothetical protein F6K22_02070 [Okeania sp. SIO2F4]|uniref:hypothetical protein n=1 Tax=Okeania sp. SIO2F4 TaxID=2607790 RepID=UPI00142A6880|nr:hypothetical protein [Okeania sp. SIO2F4]NES01713.1 hypothetical protein [Okeania sp. SIO2F4]